MENIVELFEKKRKLVQEIYLNTQNQEYFLKIDKDDKFIELIEARQILIDELLEVSDKIKNLGEIPLNLKDLQREIDEKISIINEVDNKNKEFIEKTQEKIGNRISYMKKSKRAFVNGYSKTIGPNYSSKIDKKK